MVHACNSNNLKAWYPKDCSSKPAWEISLWNPISKVTREEWTGGVTQADECLPASMKPWVQTPVPQKNKEITSIENKF
jgi:hypothetical protein